MKDFVVRFLDDTTSKASIVSSAAQADVALLQLDNVPPDLSPAMLGDSDAAEVGDQILIIGAPYGIRHTMTVGYISGRRQSQSPCPSMTPFEFLQTDAAINQGNSGGPMLNMQGRVIGIVSRILSRSGGSEGLGFAVGINMEKLNTLAGYIDGLQKDNHASTLLNLVLTGVQPQMPYAIRPESRAAEESSWQ